MQEGKRDTILVSIDVKSLYTNIPYHEGIESVKEKPNVQTDKPIATKVIIKFLFLILTLNNFILNNISYLQIKGCAMGTICATSYANIFMGKFESIHIHRYIGDKAITFLRYIDDLFFIWKGTKGESYYHS